jgi:hypothetical protein
VISEFKKEGSCFFKTKVLKSSMPERELEKDEVCLQVSGWWGAPIFPWAGGLPAVFSGVT